MSKETPAKEPEVATPPPNLRQKLATIRAALTFIEARGKNTFHNYQYVKAADVQGIVGKALAEHGIVIGMRGMQIARSEAATSKGNTENVVEWICEYGYLDAHSDEQLWYPAIGEGRDSGDKAVYKARTGAFKYFLTQSLCLGLGDDPEETGDEDHERGSKGAKPVERTPYQKTVADAPKITAAQVTEIMSLIEQSGDPEAAARGVCRHFNVTELADLTTLNANVAITTLKTKLARAKAQPASNADSI